MKALLERFLLAGTLVLAPALAHPADEDLPGESWDAPGEAPAYADESGPPAGGAVAEAPDVAPPDVAPPAPPAARPPSPPAQAEVRTPAGVPAGQWVHTSQYGWVWMPYADDYTYAPPDGSGDPYQYVYCASVGWTWVVAPWVWGWGPWPYFGYVGPVHYGWYGQGWWRTPGRWHPGPYTRGGGWGAPGRGGWRGGAFPAPRPVYRGGGVAPGPRAAYPGGYRGGGAPRSFVPGFRGGSGGGFHAPAARGFSGGSRGGGGGGGHARGGHR